MKIYCDGHQNADGTWEDCPGGTGECECCDQPFDCNGECPCDWGQVPCYERNIH